MAYTPPMKSNSYHHAGIVLSTHIWGGNRQTIAGVPSVFPSNLERSSYSGMTLTSQGFHASGSTQGTDGRAPPVLTMVSRAVNMKKIQYGVPTLFFRDQFSYHFLQSLSSEPPAYCPSARFPLKF